MGWDAFGLPAEEHARKTGEHPASTPRTTSTTSGGSSRCWASATTGIARSTPPIPNYVKWTQWIFLQIYNSYFDEEEQKARPVSELEAKGWTKEQIDDVRLAYVAEAPVNWCPSLGTVLANEEVAEWEEKGHSPSSADRCGSGCCASRSTPSASSTSSRPRLAGGHQAPPAQLDRPLRGSEREVLAGGHPDGVGRHHRSLHHPSRHSLRRHLHGARPEHPLVEVRSPPTSSARRSRPTSKTCATKSEMERGELNKEKTGRADRRLRHQSGQRRGDPGLDRGLCHDGLRDRRHHGRPAHDTRDYEFAEKFDLPIVQVVDPPEDEDWRGFTGDGTSVNSGQLDGLATPEAKKKITAWLEENGIAARPRSTTSCATGSSRASATGASLSHRVEGRRPSRHPEDELPLLAPELEDYNPTGDPEPLLSKATDWVELPDGSPRNQHHAAVGRDRAGTTCATAIRCNIPSRFLSPQAEQVLAGRWRQLRRGVDLYIGGTEHAVLHLLYARFWHKILNDLGHLHTREPFQKLVNQGLLQGADGRKMSKSFGNVVNPDEVVAEHGTDALRLYLMFMGPLEQGAPWNTQGVEGISRFLARVWRVALERNQEGEWTPSPKLTSNDAEDAALVKIVHATIKKVGEDVEKLRFNTAISQMMECANAFTSAKVLPQSLLDQLLIVLNPFAPHLTEELWERLGRNGRCTEQPWPEYDESLLVEEEIEIVVQVNGKVRGKIQIAADTPEAEIEAAALANENVRSHTEGKSARMVKYVPGRLVSIVAK